MASKFDVSGLGRLQRELNELERRAESLSGSHQVSLAELFNASFLQEYTSFRSISDLETAMEGNGFRIETQEDWDRIPEAQLDAFVAQHTRFANWQEMLQEAAEEWTKRQLGL